MSDVPLFRGWFQFSFSGRGAPGSFSTCCPSCALLVFWVLGLGFWVLGFGYWVLGFGWWVLGFGFWVLGLRLRV